MANSYIVYNSAMATTAAPVKQPTGTAIRTMMQLAPAVPIEVVEWGCSFDGSAAAVPGIVELIDTVAVFATALTTAYAAADIQPYNDPNGQVNTAGTTGTPLNLGTGLSGFSTAAITEGSIVASRMGDVQLVAPTNQYVKQFPLGERFKVPNGHALRVRATFPVTINGLFYVIFSV